MSAAAPPPLIRHLPGPGARLADGTIDGDAVLGGFTDYADEIGLELYPAQEEAIFEVVLGNHVILNTPTGSGKSLVGPQRTSPRWPPASAACTRRRSRRS
jgi:hypothetical protein